MLFAIDVGNSEIAAGVFEKDRLTTSFRVHTDAHATADELGLIFTDLLRQRDIDKRGIDAVAVSNVVPDLARAIDELSRRYLHCTPLVVGPNVEIGMRVRYDDPHQVGGDRIANAVATKSIHGLPAVIVDFGTATTFDAVSADGDYLGGAIAPGMLVSLEALVAH